MENYGFVPLTVEEANVFGLPSGTGLFSDLFAYMKTDLDNGKIKRADVGNSLKMSPEEKEYHSLTDILCLRKYDL